MDQISFRYIEGHDAYKSAMALTLFDLDQKFFPTPWSLDSWENLFVDHQRLLVLAEIKGDVVGFCLFDKVPADSFAHLLKIVIRPDLRKRGYSYLLLEGAIKNLERSGCTQLFLEVEESNIGAQKLYLSHGFKVIHRKKDFYGENRAALIMIKSSEI